MSEIRLIEAKLTIVFDLLSRDEEGYSQEYLQLADTEQDAIGQWLRMAKAKGEAGESDPVLLHLMVELYRKMDRLEQILTDNTPKRLELQYQGMIERIGLEHFELREPQLEVGTTYYGRIVLPSLSSKETGLYFEAVSPTLAKINCMRPQDENEWMTYMRARERVMIREMKGTVI